jgi:hypothetical protein
MFRPRRLSAWVKSIADVRWALLDFCASIVLIECPDDVGQRADVDTGACSVPVGLHQAVIILVGKYIVEDLVGVGGRNESEYRLRRCVDICWETLGGAD